MGRTACVENSLPARLHGVWGKPQEPCTALGSNCTGDNLLPISSAVLVAGAWGIRLGPSFRVALWLHCCPSGERGGNVGSISGRAEAKGSGCPGENQWLMSLCSSSCSCWKSGSLGTLFLNDLLSNFGKPRSPSCGLGVWTSARCCSGRLPASLTPV